MQPAGMCLVAVVEPSLFPRHKRRSLVSEAIQWRNSDGFPRRHTHAEIHTGQPPNIQSCLGQFGHRNREGVARSDRRSRRGYDRTAFRDKLAGQPLNLLTVHRPKRERTGEFGGRRICHRRLMPERILHTQVKSAGDGCVQVESDEIQGR